MDHPAIGSLVMFIKKAQLKKVPRIIIQCKPFCKITIGDFQSQKKFRTSIDRKNGKNPVWDYKIIHDLNNKDSQVLIEIWDFHSLSSDSPIGQVLVHLRDIIDNNIQESRLPIMLTKKGKSKEVGDIEILYSFYQPNSQVLAQMENDVLLQNKQIDQEFLLIEQEQELERQQQYKQSAKPVQQFQVQQQGPSIYPALNQQLFLSQPVLKQQIFQPQQSIVNFKNMLNIKPQSAVLTRDTDIITKMDPYVVIKIGKEKYTTYVDKEGSKRPKWTDFFKHIVQPTDICIEFEIWNHNLLTSHDMVGKGFLDINDVRKYDNSTMEVNLTMNGIKKSCGKLTVFFEWLSCSQQQNQIVIPQNVVPQQQQQQIQVQSQKPVQIQQQPQMQFQVQPVQQLMPQPQLNINVYQQQPGAYNYPQLSNQMFQPQVMQKQPNPVFQPYQQVPQQQVPQHNHLMDSDENRIKKENGIKFLQFPQQQQQQQQFQQQPSYSYPQVQHQYQPQQFQQQQPMLYPQLGPQSVQIPPTVQQQQPQPEYVKQFK